LIVLSVVGFAAVGRAQQAAGPAPFKRTVLQQVDLSVPGHEAVTAVAEVQPHAMAGRHSHPGEEMGYILEGTFLIELDGKPPMTLNAGQSFTVPAGAIHNATNQTGAVGKILSTYVLEKGKPLATPAPAK